MPDSTATPEPIDVEGTLRWNEFEGGFWSLETSEDNGELGPVLVLQQFDPPSGAGDGSLLRARIVARPELVDFFMAGTRVDVLDVELRD